MSDHRCRILKNDYKKLSAWHEADVSHGRDGAGDEHGFGGGSQAGLPGHARQRTTLEGRGKARSEVRANRTLLFQWWIR